MLLDLAEGWRGVLAPHGSIAVELGDSYSGSGGGGGDYLPGGFREGQQAFRGTSAKAANAAHWRHKQQHRASWPRPKSLCGIPTLFAWSLAYGRNLLAEPLTAVELLERIDGLCASGMSAEAALSAAGSWVVEHDNRHVRRFAPWLVRNVIVWARSNPAVGSLGDKFRPATSYITVATPSPSRWFDLDAVRGTFHTLATVHQTSGAPPLDHWTDEYDGDLTWQINSQGSSLAHFAMWPAKLAERLVLSMCPAEVCRTCREPRRRIVDTVQVPSRGFPERKIAQPGTLMENMRQRTEAQVSTLGWSDCGHDNYRHGRVLDAFAGTGTTLAVAEHHGRDAIGFDLDPRNRDVLWPQRRVEVLRNLGLTVPAQLDGQLSLI